MKKILILSVLTLGVIFLSGCGSQPMKQTQPTSTAPKTDETAVNQNATSTQNPATTDETTNWKTYTNTKYEFEIKYPEDWKIFTEDNEEWFKVVSYNGDEKIDGVGGILKNDAQVEFQIRKNMTLDERHQLFLDSLNEGYTKLISEDSIIIAGYPGKKIIYTSEIEGPSYNIEYWIKKDKVIYDLTMSTGVPANNKLVSIFDKMISTFKFTTKNQATADETANWKTYTNTKYGFEFKYPESCTVEKIDEDQFRVKSPTDAPYYLNIQINSNFSAKGFTMDDIIQKLKEGYHIFDEQKTTFAGLPAYEGVGTGMTNFYELAVKNGDNLYELVINTNGGDSLAKIKDGLDANQKLMLSTFKFTNN